MIEPSQRLRHRFVQANGCRLHVAEMGEGPLVLFVHGFPELWYSWRFQLPAVAAAGYRAVAYDQRGYGTSSKFWRDDAYRIDALVEDLACLVRELGGPAILVGHDWGSPVVWTAAWLYPELFRGVLGMCVPYSGRGLIALPENPFGERPPEEMHRYIAGPGQSFYQEHFGALDAVIDEIEHDLRGWVRDLTWTVSGDAFASLGLTLERANAVELTRASALCLPHGARMRDRFLTPTVLPAWFTDADLDVYTDALQRGGFAGPLAYYRNLQAGWQVLAAQANKPMVVPAAFLGGEFDVGTWWGLEAIERAPERLPNWLGSHIVAGAGHWIQQERAEETNAQVLSFLRAVSHGRSPAA